MVSGLTTGETYVFRVQAINELGLSDESQESAPLTVRAALSQYSRYDNHYKCNNICFPLYTEWFLRIHIQSCFLAPPSASYDIGLLNCDGHSMVLNWKKPLHSGGAEVKEYYVDKRRSGTTMWREVHIPPVTERLYTVHSIFMALHVLKQSNDHKSMIF